MADQSARLYRVDRFVVPNAAREEFLGSVQKTHDLLRTQPGFIQDMLLENPAGPDAFNLVTIVEWESADVVERVSAAVQALHRQIGFDKQEVFARLGVQAEIGAYTRAHIS